MREYGRCDTINDALFIFRERGLRSVVEIGSIRRRGNIDGDGYSTVAWAMHAGDVVSVDTDPNATALTAELTARFGNVTALTEDGEAYLRRHGRAIDLLYLDGWDANLEGSPEFHLRCYEAASPWLHEDSLILIDDCNGVDGKGRLVVPRALRDGWRIVFGRLGQLLLARRVGEEWFYNRVNQDIPGLRKTQVVVAPWYGEFGHMILEHVRYVHAIQAPRKIVCCEHGQESLYPSATGFDYDWENPIPDGNRTRSGAWSPKVDYAVARSRTVARLRLSYPGHEVLSPSYYPCAWHMSDLIKFRPEARAYHSPTDVVICSRKRQFNPERNYSWYDNLAEDLRARGLRVGIAGTRECSYDFGAEERAWLHPDGETAGTVDLLANCRLYVGGDTGVTHLAALMDVPSFVFKYNLQHDFTGLAARANKGVVEVYQGDPVDWRRMAEAVVGLLPTVSQ